MRNTIIATLSLLILAAAATTASASYLSMPLVGSNGTNLSASATPGTSFSLDFRPAIAGRAFAPREVNFIFESSATTFATLSIDLDSSDTVFSFDPWTGNSKQVAYKLYDPQITLNPGSGYPTTPIFTPITQQWIDELSDGVLSGKLWVNDAPAAPSSYLFSAGMLIETPEPACGIFVPLACVLLTRRRRNA